MKKLLFLVLTITIAVPVFFLKSSFAQSDLQDAVYLKDGTILRGVIREQLPDSLVKIEIMGGNIIAVTSKDLDHIQYKVKHLPVVAIPEKSDSIHYTDHGYFNITEMGVMPGTTYSYQYYGYAPQSSVGFTIQTINGYRFNRHFTVGGGLGMDIIVQPMVQLFADGRYEILKRKATPYLYLDAGYGFPITKAPEDIYSQTSFKGGFTWGTGVGMRFNFHSEGAFLIGVGYKMDKRSEEVTTDWSPYYTVNDYTYNRIAIKIGVSF